MRRAGRRRGEGRGSLVALLAAHYLSSFGNAVTVVTVPLYVLAETGSATATGLAGFAGTLPLIFAGGVGGVWIDRLGGRRVSVFSDASGGVLIGLLPLLDGVLGLPLPAILALLFGRSLVATPANVARLSLIRPAAEAAGVRLESANAWYLAAPRLGLVVGAPVAALLVVRFGAATGLYLDAAGFLLAAGLVTAGVPKSPAAAGAGGQPFVRQLVEGAVLVRRIPVIFAMTAFVFVTNFLDAAFTPVLLPVYAHDVLHDGRYLGWLVAASGCGAVLGTFLYAPASRRLLASRRITMLGCFAVIGLLRLSMAATPPPVVMVVVCLALGLATGPLNPLLTTVTLEHVPEHARGRVFGLGTAVGLSGAPLSVLAAGWMTSTVGLVTTLACFGTGYLLLVAVSVRSTVLRQMDRHAPGAPADPPVDGDRSADAPGGAAVHQQAGAGDEGGGLAGQERRDGAEVAGPAHPAERDRRADPREPGLGG